MLTHGIGPVDKHLNLCYNTGNFKLKEGDTPDGQLQ